jgi:hypothetical protein
MILDVIKELYGNTLKRRGETMFNWASITQTGVALNVSSLFSLANVRQSIFAFL